MISKPFVKNSEVTVSHISLLSCLLWLSVFTPSLRASLCLFLAIFGARIACSVEVGDASDFGRIFAKARLVSYDPLGLRGHNLYCLLTHCNLISRKDSFKFEISYLNRFSLFSLEGLARQGTAWHGLAHISVPFFIFGL